MGTGHYWVSLISYLAHVRTILDSYRVIWNGLDDLCQ